MDDFIVYALCAAVEAVEDSGWTPEDEESLERTGVMIGSGIGGLKTIEAAANFIAEKGPRRLSPFFIPSSLINLASGARVDPLRLSRAQSCGRDRVLDRSACDRRCIAPHPARRCGRHGRRRRRGRRLPHRCRRLRGGPRTLHQFQRHAGARLPPLGRGTRRIRDGGRCRRGRAGRVRARQGAGRHDLCRDHRLRHERRCPPRDRAGAGRLGAATAPWCTRSGPQSSTATRSTTSTRTGHRRRSATKSSSAPSSASSARMPGGSRCRRPSRRSGICSARRAAWS